MIQCFPARLESFPPTYIASFKKSRRLWDWAQVVAASYIIPSFSNIYTKRG